MPNYSFKCEGCDNSFDLFLKMSECDNPLKEKCPCCGKKKVIKDWSQQKNSIGADMTLTPIKVNGGAWNEVIERIKKKAPRSMQDRLEQSRTFNAGRIVR